MKDSEIKLNRIIGYYEKQNRRFGNSLLCSQAAHVVSRKRGSPTSARHRHIFCLCVLPWPGSTESAYYQHTRIWIASSPPPPLPGHGIKAKQQAALQPHPWLPPRRRQRAAGRLTRSTTGRGSSRRRSWRRQTSSSSSATASDGTRRPPRLCYR
jgi:hypothetical protein